MSIKVRRYAGLRRAPIFTRSSLPIHRFSNPWPFRIRQKLEIFLPQSPILFSLFIWNHGKSAEIEGPSPPHDLNNAAKDLANLVKSQGWPWPDLFLGHSLGGKSPSNSQRAALVATMAKPLLCLNRSLIGLYWSTLQKDLELAIARAENSDRWDPETVQQLDILAAQERGGSEGMVVVHVLPKSGHWVHVDKSQRSS